MAGLLGTTKEVIQEALTTRVVASRREVVKAKQNPARATYGRDALAKVRRILGVNSLMCIYTLVPKPHPHGLGAWIRSRLYLLYPRTQATPPWGWGLDTIEAIPTLPSYPGHTPMGMGPGYEAISNPDPLLRVLYYKFWDIEKN